jgi:hypothetical protein
LRPELNFSIVGSLSYAVVSCLSSRVRAQDVQEFHQIETSLQVKAFLSDTKDYLSKMIRAGNVSSKVLGDLDIVSDFRCGIGRSHCLPAIANAMFEFSFALAALNLARFFLLSSVLRSYAWEIINDYTKLMHQRITMVHHPSAA